MSGRPDQPVEREADPALRRAWVDTSRWAARQRSACPILPPDVTAAAAALGLPTAATPRPPNDGPPLPDVKPALKRASLDVLRALRRRLRDNPEDPTVAAWSARLMRICELRRHVLKERARFEGESLAALRQRMRLLCLLLLETFHAQRDPRLLNTALKLLDLPWMRSRLSDLRRRRRLHLRGWRRWLVVRCHVLATHGLLRMTKDEWRVPARFSLSARMEASPSLPMKPVFDRADAPGVVVFCPNPYSLYTLSVLRLLEVHGVRVQGIAVRKMLNPARAMDELRRDGPRLVRKAWKKLVLRERAYASRPYPTLASYLAEIGCVERNVVDWAEARSVEVWPCKTLNDPVVLEGLTRLRPEAVVFTGGGLIRKSVLDAAGKGVINTHMGLLPPYRGMDVVEWPILEGHPDKVGLAVHFMVKGLDEGDVLAMFSAPFAGAQDIVQLRERLEWLMPQAAVSATVRLLTGELTGESQVLRDGRQYFIVHPRLYPVALHRYRRALLTGVLNG